MEQCLPYIWADPDTWNRNSVVRAHLPACWTVATFIHYTRPCMHAWHDVRERVRICTYSRRWRSKGDGSFVSIDGDLSSTRDHHIDHTRGTIDDDMRACAAPTCAHARVPRRPASRPGASRDAMRPDAPPALITPTRTNLYVRVIAPREVPR